MEWHLRPGRRRQLDPGSYEALLEKRKAVRAKVEHPFLYVKRHFGYAKVRYRGLVKNTQGQYGVGKPKCGEPDQPDPRGSRP